MATQGWERYKSSARWIVHMDMDEYPVNPALSQRGFLLTTLEAIAARHAGRWPNGVGRRWLLCCAQCAC